MDQAKTNLPRFACNVASLRGGAMKCKLQGVYAHGRKIYIFICPESHVHSDANLAIDCLMRVLNDPDLGDLPKTLFSQIDGGKTKTLLACTPNYNGRAIMGE
jgi:hypothetical protein